MLYLGAIRGCGVLKGGGKTFGRADYDLEGFLLGAGRVASNGEIRVRHRALAAAFRCKDLTLVTDDGRDLAVSFSERQLPHQADAMHVDVARGLPPASEWPLHCEA